MNLRDLLIQTTKRNHTLQRYIMDLLQREAGDDVEECQKLENEIETVTILEACS